MATDDQFFAKLAEKLTARVKLDAEGRVAAPVPPERLVGSTAFGRSMLAATDAAEIRAAAGAAPAGQVVYRSARPVNLADRIPAGYAVDTDATAILTTALADADGVVEWPEGQTLTLASPVTIPAGTVLRMGEGAKAIVTHNEPAFKVFGALDGGEINRPTNATVMNAVAAQIMPGSKAARVSGITASGGNMSGVVVGGEYNEAPAVDALVDRVYVPDCLQFGVRIDNSAGATVRDAVVEGAGLDCIKVRLKAADTRIVGGRLKGARAGDGIDGFAGMIGGYIGGGLVVEDVAQSGVVVKTDNATDATPLATFLAQNGLPKQTIIDGVIIRRAGGTGLALHRSDSTDSDVTGGVQLPWLADVQVGSVVIEDVLGNGMFINGYNMSVSQVMIIRSKSEAVRVHANARHVRLHQVISRGAGFGNPVLTIDAFILHGKHVNLSQCASFGTSGDPFDDASEAALTKVTRFGFTSANGSGAVAGHGATHHFSQCYSYGHKTGSLGGTETIGSARHFDCDYEGYGSGTSLGGLWLRNSAGALQQSTTGTTNWTAVGGTGSPPGDATEAAKGVIELATAAEAQAGTDTTRAITPATLKLIADARALVEHEHEVADVNGLNSHVTTLAEEAIERTVADPSFAAAVTGIVSPKFLQFVAVSTGTEARPAGGMVLWVGGTERPANMAAGDVWLSENGSITPPGNPPTSVTATPPTWTDNTAAGGGSWTTPAITGVTYSPASGSASSGQSVTVTATAQSGYALTGITSWTHVFPAAPSGFAAPTTARTVAIGDSITAANSDLAANARGMSWFNQAAILGDARMLYGANLGIGGQTSTQIAARFTADVVNRTPKPGMVLIMAGSNETAASVPTATIMANLDSMVQAAKGAGIRPVLVAPPPVVQAAQSARLLQLRDAIAAYTDCRTIVATFDQLKDASGVLASAYRTSGDDTHPNAAGQRALAEAFVGAMPTSELRPPLAMSTVARPASTLVANGVDAIMSADANSDGLADGSRYYYGQPANVTHSLVAGAPAGRWQRYTRTGLTDWSLLGGIDFDVSAIPVGSRFVLAARFRWTGTGAIGATLYTGAGAKVGDPLQNNAATDHAPMAGVLAVELVKEAGVDSYVLAFSAFPGSGDLDLAQYTGVVTELAEAPVTGTTHTVFGSAAPSVEPTWHTDGTPKIETGSGFYLYNTADSSKTWAITGGRARLPVGETAAQVILRLWITAANTAPNLSGTPAREVTVAANAGWVEGAWAPYTITPGQNFWVTMTSPDAPGGYVYAVIPDDNSIKSSAVPLYLRETAPIGRSVYRIGTGSTASASNNRAWYGTDVIITES